MNIVPVKLIYPEIPPVPEGVNRPLWSVMVPSYNCARYLGQTLKSILSQDLGPEMMQIEVVDDHSTKDDPELIVKEIGKGRVSFYRQPENVGAIRNFNTCIRRSRGRFVHILHGDDYLEDGFYEYFNRMIEDNSDTALFACRSFIINEAGTVQKISPRLESIEKNSTDSSPFFYSNPTSTPAIVVKRSFYEEHGGFCESFLHVSDWETWVRAIVKGGGLAVDKVLAYYRFYKANDTNKQIETGNNIREAIMLGRTFSRMYKNFDIRKFMKNIKFHAYRQAEQAMSEGNDIISANNAAIWWEMLSPGEKLKVCASALKNMDRIKMKILRKILFGRG